MASINSEAEVHVVGINSADATILLYIFNTVITNHHSLDVSRAITIVGDISGNLSTIHGSAPEIPVALSAIGLQIWIAVIASAPAPVVGTDHCIFLADVSLVQHNHEVIPVVFTIRVIGEVDNLRLLRVNLDVLCMNSPPSLAVILSTEDNRVRNNDSLRKCREFVHHAEGLNGSHRIFASSALEGLVIHSHQRLLSQFIDIGDSLECQILCCYSLHDTLFEIDDTSHVGNSLFQCGTDEHLTGHTRNLHRQRLLVLLRGIASDRLDSRTKETDQRALNTDAASQISLRTCRWEGTCLGVGLCQIAVGHLDVETTVRTVNCQGDFSVHLLNRGIDIVSARRVLETAAYQTSVNLLTCRIPFRVLGRVVIETDDTILSTYIRTTSPVIQYNVEVLVIFVVGVHRQVELCLPFLTSRYDISLTQCPEA